jgi:hypothetical protein
MTKVYLSGLVKYCLKEFHWFILLNNKTIDFVWIIRANVEDSIV